MIIQSSLLEFTTQATCEAASTGQYQYKWARKYYIYREIFNKKIIDLFSFFKFLTIQRLHKQNALSLIHNKVQIVFKLNGHDQTILD